MNITGIKRRFIRLVIKGFSVVSKIIQVDYPRLVDHLPLLEEGGSIIRWGDGETSLLLGRSIRYQNSCIDLSWQLFRILVKSERQFVFCLPKHIPNYNTYIDDDRYLDIWWPTIILWLIFGSRLGDVFLDAFIFRKENSHLDDVWSFMKSNNRFKVVISKDPGDVLLLNQETYHIKCPSENAFANLSHLKGQLSDVLAKIDFKSDSESQNMHFKPVVIVSMGPAGKVLIANMLKSKDYEGVQFLDVGHFFDHGRMA